VNFRTVYPGEYGGRPGFKAASTCRICGAESFRGGTTAGSVTTDFVSEVRLQFGQAKKWAMIVGSDASSEDRYHFISMWQWAHIGDTTCSKESFSLSTIACAPWTKREGPRWVTDLRHGGNWERRTSQNRR